MIGFVGLDIHIRPGLTDQVHGDGLFLRVVHGDEVRVGTRQHLPAGGAAKAGLPLPPAEDGRRQEPGQGVLSRPGGAGDQIEMGDMPHGNAPGQILFQLFIAQEGFKRHIFSSFVNGYDDIFSFMGKFDIAFGVEIRSRCSRSI